MRMAWPKALPLAPLCAGGDEAGSPGRSSLSLASSAARRSVEIVLRRLTHAPLFRAKESSLSMADGFGWARSSGRFVGRFSGRGSLYSAAKRSAVSRSTETICDTPRSGMVTP